MNWGMAIWTCLYGGITLLVWVGVGGLAAIVFLAGLAVAVVTIMLADWMTREKTIKRRIHDDADY